MGSSAAQSFAETNATRTLASLLQPLQPLIEHHSLTELMVNADGSVWVEKSGRLSSTPLLIEHDLVYSIIRELAGYYDLVCNRESPTLACRLPVFTAGRVQAVVPPISDGPMLSIRFPSRTKIALKHLVKRGSLEQSQADQLTQYLVDRKNIVIAGGTGSGKTTLANALLDQIDDQRIVVIEDTPEISLKNRNTVYWQTTHSFTPRDAVKTALRVRPDRIILGEVRDSAALEWAKAAQSGHPGSLCTIHASSADAVRRRMYALMQEAVVTPSEELIDAAIDIVVFVSKTTDQSKRIVRKVETILSSKSSNSGKENLP